MASDNQIGALADFRWLLLVKGEKNDGLEGLLSGLFNELRGPLFRYLVVLLGSPAEAEDIAQECFLRLFVELRSGKKIGTARSWLFRVGHNLAVDRLRDPRAEACLDADTLNLPDARQLSSEETLLHEERLSLMRCAIGRLSRQQRLCLHLRTEGFRYREIAEILGVSESTICENIRRGLSRLMKECHDA